jgi:hypothetical protein
MSGYTRALSSSVTLVGTPTLLQKITDSNLFRNSWKTIYNIINDNITDPIAGTRKDAKGNLSTKWVYTDYPDEHFLRSAYPRITVGTPRINRFKDITFGSSAITDVIIEIPVTIFSTRKDQLEQIADDVQRTIYNNKNTIYSQGLEMQEMPRAIDATYIIEDIKIHSKTITFRFQYLYGD